MLAMKKSRDANIELLRILMAISIIFVHWIELYILSDKSHSFYGVKYVYALCKCAVPVFIIISGYYMCMSFKRDISKALFLILELIFVNEAVVVLDYFVSGNISKRAVINALIPNNYYVILYVTLFIISAYINKLINIMNAKQFKQLLIISFLIFSVWNTLVDLACELEGREITGLGTIGAYGSAYGMNIVTFAFFYLIGAFIRLEKLDEKIKLSQCLCAVVILPAIIVAWSLVDEHLTVELVDSAWTYTNPLIQILAAFVFISFLKIRISSVKAGNIINIFAGGSFMCYLIHYYIISKVGGRCVSERSIIVIVRLAVMAVLIYIVALLCSYIWNGIKKIIPLKAVVIYNDWNN